MNCGHSTLVPKVDMMLIQGKGIPHVGKLYCCSAPYQTLQHQQSEVLCRQSQRVQAALTELLVQHIEVVAGQSLAVLGGMCTCMYMYALQRPCPYYCSVAYNNP